MKFTRCIPSHLPSAFAIWMLKECFCNSCTMHHTRHFHRTKSLHVSLSFLYVMCREKYSAQAHTAAHIAVSMQSPQNPNKKTCTKIVEIETAETSILHCSTGNKPVSSYLSRQTKQKKVQLGSTVSYISRQTAQSKYFCFIYSLQVLQYNLQYCLLTL